MTAVFRSCLPGFYTNANPSISSEHLSTKTKSISSLNDEEEGNNSVDRDQQKCSNQNQIDLSSLAPIKTKKTSMKNNKTNKKRGPCYTRITEQRQSLLKQLVSTLFGNNNQSQVSSSKKPRTKRSISNTKNSLLPSQSTIKKQFENNEQTLRSLVTLLTQIESNIQLKPTQISSTNENQNNNRIDDTSSSHSSDIYHHKSKAKQNNHQHVSIPKRYATNRSIKRHYCHKKRQSEEHSLSSSSIISHYSLQSSAINRRKMVDNQQQTQIYPSKINIGTSTYCNNPTDDNTTYSEASWLDVIQEDQTTVNAWARIRRRLKPNQQKDILKALMIICANLFEVPIENKHI